MKQHTTSTSCFLDGLAKSLGFSSWNDVSDVTEMQRTNRCEVVQMEFGLRKFKLGECLFSCFKQEKYSLQRAEVSSYSQHKHNTRARSAQLLYICNWGPALVIYFGLLFVFLVGFSKKSWSESASGHQAIITNCEILLLVPKNRESGYEL
jgi:hypothetical protein